MDSVTRFRKDVEYKIEVHNKRLGLPPGVIEMAKDLYGSFNDKDIIYTRPDDVFALAAIYLSVRVRNEPMTPEDIVKGTDVDESHVIRAYKSMVSELAKTRGLVVQTGDADKFIEKYGKEVGASEATILKAKEILEQTKDLMENKANSTKAASSLYVASILTNDKVLQKDISEVSGVSGASIRNRYKEQLDELDLAESLN